MSGMQNHMGAELTEAECKLVDCYRELGSGSTTRHSQTILLR